MKNNLDNMFGDMFGTINTLGDNNLAAPMNISKIDDLNIHYIQLKVPGYREDEISVDSKIDDQGYKLIISGKFPQSDVDLEESNLKYSHKDFDMEHFKNIVKITREIAEGDFQVSLDNGILTIQCTPDNEKNLTRNNY